MRYRLLTVLAITIILGSSALSGQFLPEEIIQRPEIEEMLRTAEIRSFKEIGEGVTRPFVIFLCKNDVECKGVWKNPQGIQKGYLEGWKYEIAAYELDKLMDIRMIPPTVERKLNNACGSLQLWVDYRFSDLKRMERGINIPQEKLLSWSKRKYLMRAFDCLIANEDRTQQNILYTDDWRTILIDHSRSFRSSPRFTKRLVYGRNGLVEKRHFRFLPRSFMARLKKLDFAMIKNAVGNFLTDKEIQAIVLRKKLILEEIAEMIQEKGENKVLY